jgi:hypothetical protein
MWVVLLAVLATASQTIVAQQPPQAQSAEQVSFGSKFFDQLHAIFGKFQNAELDRVFQQSKPIQCSELVGRKGEWRPVAFFNENRKLGDWCRESLEEVKADLAVYSFKGTCGGEQGAVQVSTEFPTAAGMAAYNQQRIDLDKVDVTMNDPVPVVFNSRTSAYTFELPYLFLSGRESNMNLYTFIAPDRNSSYAPEVTSRWECKAVSSKDVTYRFLICRTATVPSRAIRKNERWEPAFGASAYFILSDGTEAQSSVNLTFGDPQEKP